MQRQLDDGTETIADLEALHDDFTKNNIKLHREIGHVQYAANNDDLKNFPGCVQTALVISGLSSATFSLSMIDLGSPNPSQIRQRAPIDVVRGLWPLDLNTNPR
jgi:hypothetical protein